MILLLGKNDAVEEYANDVLNNSISRLPHITTHHTEFEKYIDAIREEKPPVVTTQNIEFVDALLQSDLNFAVVTVRRYSGEVKARTMTKADVLTCRLSWNFDPRD